MPSPDAGESPLRRPAATARFTQEERRAEAERRLIDAAAELIGEVGPSRVTLALVGERAGYSRGLATHHFGSKGALMQRVVDLATARFREALRVRSRSPAALDELLALVRTFLDLVSDLPPVHRACLVLAADAVASGSPDVRPAMASFDRLFRDEVRRGIARGIAAGEFPRSVDPQGLATVVVAMLRGVAFQWMVDGAVDLDASLQEIERLLTARLRRPAGPGAPRHRKGSPR